ncbi:hypothetical protein Y032_0004g1906 [Ancylostoma ceylanicum]|uniref:Uncharacterized protein n=1 Tax=Ancylostoma ceylanicum TaxID=53326 RepID=A0A016VTW9_9BILA|nr:hypothetical protein Y032_0004g1906 [Ancylostoma ceylanicum]
MYQRPPSLDFYGLRRESACHQRCVFIAKAAAVSIEASNLWSICRKEEKASFHGYDNDLHETVVKTLYFASVDVIIHVM